MDLFIGLDQCGRARGFINAIFIIPDMEMPCRRIDLDRGHIDLRRSCATEQEGIGGGLLNVLERLRANASATTRYVKTPSRSTTPVKVVPPHDACTPYCALQMFSFARDSNPTRL